MIAVKKFSIIVPVYNVEAYLDKCLSSLVKQNYNDYEVIVVNDGSIDKSREIMKKYEKEYMCIKAFDKENTGVSDTRNYGITLARGEYLVFIDSDDYVDSDFLFNLEKYTYEKPDIIKYQYKLIYSDHVEVINDNINSTKIYDGETLFKELTYNKKPYDLACIYAFNKKYFDNNNFKFEINCYHEDFALIPITILKAHSIVCASDVFYNYVQRNNSIMHMNSYEKNKKRVYDMLHHFDNMYKIINKDNKLSKETKELFNSYISNAVICRIDILNNDDKKDYIKDLKKRRIFDLIQSKTFGQKLKKIYYKIKYR